MKHIQTVQTALVLASMIFLGGCNKVGSVGGTPGFGTADIVQEQAKQRAAIEAGGWAEGWTHRETGRPVTASDIWRCEVEAAQVSSSSQVGRVVMLGVLGSAGGEQSLQGRCLEAAGYLAPGQPKEKR